jgi:5-methylcytosine-specific restriction endonuclease McrA
LVTNHRPADINNKVLGYFRPKEIWPFVGECPSFMPFGEWQVRTESARLRLFKENPQCVCCGLAGTIFLLELPLNKSGQPKSEQHRPHLNFYAEQDGGLTLMTKDHIVPRSKGGHNGIGNMQTMCVNCNGAKGNQNLTLAELRAVLQIAGKAATAARHQQVTRLKARPEVTWAA